MTKIYSFHVPYDEGAILEAIATPMDIPCSMEQKRKMTKLFVTFISRHVPAGVFQMIKKVMLHVNEHGGTSAVLNALIDEGRFDV